MAGPKCLQELETATFVVLSPRMYAGGGLKGTAFTACVRTANFKIRGGSPRIHAGEGALQRSGKTVSTRSCALALVKQLAEKPNAFGGDGLQAVQ
jgi:hypothetical protein